MFPGVDLGPVQSNDGLRIVKDTGNVRTSRLVFWARPGYRWPLGSFCALEPDKHGQLWQCPPNVCCEECGRTYSLGGWTPKRVPENCPRCDAPVPTESEPA